MTEPREAPTQGHRGPEPWAWAGFLVAGLTAILHIYIGQRTGGRGPILAYTWGRTILFAASGLLLLVGIFWSLRRPPIQQRRRLTALLALGASVWLSSFFLPYPSSHDGHPSPLVFQPPFQGTWETIYSGNKVRTNPLLLDPARRHGWAFEPDGGASTVLAPTAGRVEALGEAGRSGAWIVLELDAGERPEYLVLDGLAPGSLRVGPGQEVQAGDPLAEVVRSFVLYLQDDPEPGRGEGIPFRIEGL